MPALRFCPNDDTKLQLVNLEEGKENVAEFVIKNPDDVVVQVFNAGLCGTDIHIVQVQNSYFTDIGKDMKFFIVMIFNIVEKLSLF